MPSSELTAAPYPLKLFKKDGTEEEFLASPLTDQDYDSLDQWVQSQVVAIARNSLREEEVSQAQYDEEMGIAYTAALGISIYEPRGIAVVNTPAGVARILWQMIHKEHPTIKHKDLIGYCRQIENRTEILSVFRKLNPGDVAPEDSDEEPEKNE